MAARAVAAALFGGSLLRRRRQRQQQREHRGGHRARAASPERRCRPRCRPRSSRCATSRGRPVSLGEHRGGVAVVAFLDSSCTACVLIAQQVRGALDELEHPPPLLLVSVDPSRDSRARVEAFLRRVSLGGRASYLVGPRAALERVWRKYRVATPGRGGDYERALPVLLIDAHGRERVEYQQEQLTPDALAHDIRALQAG